MSYQAFDKIKCGQFVPSHPSDRDTITIAFNNFRQWLEQRELRGNLEDFMYMGMDNCHYYFKHVISRKYVYVEK